ncbi:hypothetical protein [Variovorax paradoxus]|uniref:hypothetical protein n=1 Tax=Variovorax paradoxus TaxID=34073 RepID=UPI00247FB58B|nr:hypothetical protein [Variovorax paradoxus]WGT64817.1 hypothetical protein QHG62_05600 [Variovorax paradoxus]
MNKLFFLQTVTLLISLAAAYVCVLAIKERRKLIRQEKLVREELRSGENKTEAIRWAWTTGAAFQVAPEAARQANSQAVENARQSAQYFSVAQDILYVPDSAAFAATDASNVERFTLPDLEGFRVEVSPLISAGRNLPLLEHLEIDRDDIVGLMGEFLINPTVANDLDYPSRIRQSKSSDDMKNFMRSLEAA